MFIEAIKAEVKKLSKPAKIKQYMRFFKTGPGQYGQGDIFAGIPMPQCRKIAKNFEEMPLIQVEELVKSKIHEERIIALVVMINKYKQGQKQLQEEIYKMYLKQMKWVNNWDLVDISAPHIVGNYLLARTIELEKDKKINKKNDPCAILYKWAQSVSLWERRISIISTFEFIKANRFDHTIKISQILLKDKEDLIHKAVGWMLRQVGKRDTNLLEQFLQEHYDDIPRTTLRYSIQKFDETKRKSYLNKTFEPL